LRFGAHPALVGREQRRNKRAMQNSPAGFAAKEWTGADGLRLSVHDYPGGKPGRPPLLCLHGLTRNARDFQPLADRFAGEWRLIAPDMRGRGQSEYARDSSTYDIPTYAEDVRLLLETLDCGPVAIIGTSMGGLIALHLALAHAWPLAGVVLNDVGPALEPAGLARIREYVGQGGSFETWMHAARHLREQFGKAHPEFAIADWLAFAKRTMDIAGNGRIVFDYDMKIAEPFNAPEPPGIDLWPAFRALRGVPALVLRGELSDLLSAATVKAMKKELPDLQAVTVKRVGHAPTLAEPEARQAIAAFLAEVA
jgi:pimeloyl-ACP methyl ester carboxylesterase